MSANSRVSSAWFAAGMALTTATQFRVGGMSLGPGEALLVAWTGITIVTALMPQRHRPSSRLDLGIEPLGWVLFCGIAGTALTAGWLVSWENAALERQHDALAFAFAALVLSTFVVPAGRTARFERSLAYLLLLAFGPLGVLLVAGLVRETVGPIVPWYYSRFAGWAENPNQLALLTVAAPFLCVRLGVARRLAGRVGFGLLGLTSIAVGLASQSDALKLAWLTGATVLGLATWWRSVSAVRRNPRSAALVLGVAPLVLLICAVGIWHAAIQSAEDAAQSLYDEGGQGEERMERWRNGVQAILSSPLVGLGPGAHLTTEPQGEAHNTLIDWGASTGIVGLAAYATILGWVALRIARGGSAALGAAFGALVAFSMFHYVLRQPIYWFYVLAILILAPPAIGSPWRTPIGANRPMPFDRSPAPAEPAYRHPRSRTARTPVSFGTGAAFQPRAGAPRTRRG